MKMKHVYKGICAISVISLLIVTSVIALGSSNNTNSEDTVIPDIYEEFTVDPNDAINYDDISIIQEETKGGTITYYDINLNIEEANIVNVPLGNILYLMDHSGAILGDCNDDGDITLADRDIIWSLQGIEKSEDDGYLPSADMDKNEFINSADVLLWNSIYNLS